MDWLESLRQFDSYEDPDDIEYIDFHTLESPTKGRVWINNGKDHLMIYSTDSIPEGWTRGRVNVHSDKDRFKTQGLLNNPNKKTWIVYYTDGSSEVVSRLPMWCRKNNYNISTIKGLIRRGRVGHRRTNGLEKYNHILSIKVTCL